MAQGHFHPWAVYWSCQKEDHTQSQQRTANSHFRFPWLNEESPGQVSLSFPAPFLKYVQKEFLNLFYWKLGLFPGFMTYVLLCECISQSSIYHGNSCNYYHLWPLGKPALGEGEREQTVPTAARWWLNDKLASAEHLWKEQDVGEDVFSLGKLLPAYQKRSFQSLFVS